MMRLIFIIISIVLLNQGCNGSSRYQIEKKDSIFSRNSNDNMDEYNSNDTINKRYDDLNKLGIDSILIELNYPKYGEIFLSAQNSYYQKEDIFGDMLYPKYAIDDDSWKILINGINKFVVLKEPFLVKKVKRSDGLIVEVDYPTYLNIYIYI